MILVRLIRPAAIGGGSREGSVLPEDSRILLRRISRLVRHHWRHLSRRAAGAGEKLERQFCSGRVDHRLAVLANHRAPARVALDAVRFRVGAYNPRGLHSRGGGGRVSGDCVLKRR